MSQRLHHIDILRTLAIFFIIICHLPSHGFLGFLDSVYNYFAIVGLGLFFFMSGYLLYYKHKDITTIHDVSSFLKNRAIRIYPLYWVFLFVYLLMYVQIGKMISINVPDLCIYLLGFHMIFPNNVPRIPYLWFIGTLILYYFMFPILIKCSKSCKSILLSSILILIVFSLIKFKFGIIDDTFFIYYFMFIAGILGSRFEKTLISIKRYLIFLVFSAWTSVSQIKDYTIEDNLIMSIIWKDIFIISIILILWILSIEYSSKINNRLKLAFSNISFAGYSIYLFHPIALIVFNRSFIYLFHLEGYSIFKDIFVLFVGSPIIVICSYYISHLESKYVKKFTFSSLKEILLLWKRKGSRIP